MKNLYIYRFDGESVKKSIYQDVKCTRDGNIVEKSQANYKLSHGIYKDKEDLNSYLISKPYNYDKIISVEYFSYEDDVSIEKLVNPFIEERKNKIQELQQEINNLNQIKLDNQ